MIQGEDFYKISSTLGNLSLFSAF